MTWQIITAWNPSATIIVPPNMSYFEGLQGHINPNGWQIRRRERDDCRRQPAYVQLFMPTGTYFERGLDCSQKDRETGRLTAASVDRI